MFTQSSPWHLSALVRLLVVFLTTITISVDGLARDSLPSQTVELAERSVVRIVATNTSGTLLRRVASGFAWRSPDRVVTALHVVIGAENILVEAAGTRIEATPARIIAQDKEGDLALLALDRPLSSGKAFATTAIPAPGVALWVIGYPLEVTGMRSARLNLSDIAPSTLAGALDANARIDLADLGFPSTSLAVLHVEGSLLPGDSGSPIINSFGEVVGIGNGGLQRGTVGLGWGIPSNRLHNIHQRTNEVLRVEARRLARIQSSFFATQSGERLEAALWQTAAQRDKLESYQDFLERFPNGAFAEAARLKVVDIERKYSRALEYFRHAMELQASLGAGGEVSRVREIHSRIEDNLKRAIQVYPGFQAAYFELGRTKYMMAGLLPDGHAKIDTLKEAIKSFDDTLDMNPELAEPYLFRGYAYSSLEDYKASCDSYIKFQRLKQTLSPIKFNAYRQQLRFSKEFLTYNGCATPPDLDYIGPSDLQKSTNNSAPVERDCKQPWYTGEAQYCAEKGSPDAMDRVAQEMYTTANSVSFLSPKDTEKIEGAVRWAHELASRDDRRGFYHLGKFYANAYGKPKISGLAFSYLRKAADLEHPESFHSLGYFYFEGAGTTKDVDAARQAWARGAVLGDIFSSSQLTDFQKKVTASERLDRLRDDLIQIVERGNGTPYRFKTKIEGFTDRLEEAFVRFGNEYMLGRAVDSLASMKGFAPASVPVMVKQYPNLPESVRKRIRVALGSLGFGTREATFLMANVALSNRAAEEPDRINLNDDARQRAEALIALASFGSISTDIVDQIAPLLKSKDRYVRLLTLSVIGETKDKSKRRLIEPLIDDTSNMVKVEAARYFTALGQQ